jgi:hypothetical protein
MMKAIERNSAMIKHMNSANGRSFSPMERGRDQQHLVNKRHKRGIQMSLDLSGKQIFP